MSTADLLAACRSGQAEAREAFCDAHGARVYRWAVLLGLRPPEAEDAAQEVLVIALSTVDRCRAAEALPSWLFQITRRVAANHRRRSWWRRAVFGADPAEGAFTASGPDLERELTIRACLAALPRRQLEVLILMDVEGYTREEAAQALRLAPGTVASRLRLARAAFRARWEERSPAERSELSWSEGS